MRRVTGIGGIFFNAKDPVALRSDALGYRLQEWGGGRRFTGPTKRQAQLGHDHLVYRRAEENFAPKSPS